MKTLLQFGAGKIGRSFIAQVFNRAGYRIVFVDIDPCVVKAINESGAYRVVFRDQDLSEEYIVKNISAIEVTSTKSVIEEISSADIISVAVGRKSLVKLAPLFARGIKNRYKKRPDAPVDIILAENIRNAAELLSTEIRKRIPDIPLDQYLGLVETSIGKMVPLLKQEQVQKDPLTVFTERYNNLIVDGKAFRAGIPQIPFLVPKNEMKAWVDRRLFIHNLGHAALSYNTDFHYPDVEFTWQALEIPEIAKTTKNVMLQSAEILQSAHSREFNMDELLDHIDDLLKRFANKALSDTIFRVGCDLWRKLGRDDRLISPVLKAREIGLPYGMILETWVKGCFFGATDENGKYFPEDRPFVSKFGQKPAVILKNHCNFNPVDDRWIFEEVAALTRNLETEIKRAKARQKENSSGRRQENFENRMP